MTEKTTKLPTASTVVSGHVLVNDEAVFEHRAVREVGGHFANELDEDAVLTRVGQFTVFLKQLSEIILRRVRVFVPVS